VSPLLPRPGQPERWPEEVDEERELGGGETMEVAEVPGELVSMPAEQVLAEERKPAREPAPVPEASEVEVPTALRREIERAMRRYPQKRSASIPALWAVQRRYGWCTPEGIRQAAAVMGVTPGSLQAVASFYDLFRLEPQGEHQVLVCTNISCWLRGADDLLDAFCEAAGTSPGGSSEDGKFFVRGFECLGACELAPMASIDERYYGPLEPGDAEAAVEQMSRRGAEVLPEKRLGDRGAAGGKRTAADKRLTKHPVNKPMRPRPKSARRKAAKR
jgi:NADH-quinone oxidoreductase subunit E